MKSVLCTALLCGLVVLSCSTPAGPEDPTIEGGWYGRSTATYPGPDDGPVTEWASIAFTFTDEAYQFWQAGFQPPTIAINGVYELRNDSRILLAQTTPAIPVRPLRLMGEFELEVFEDSLHLRQVRHPDSWPETWEVSLRRGIPEIIGQGQ
jgi:hypothetical protein